MSKSVPKTLMPIIAVSSVDATRNFYVEKLGFAHIMGVVGKDGELEFGIVNRDGAQIMLVRAQAPMPSVPRQAVDLYIEVDDVEALHASVAKSKSVKITEGLVTQWWGDRTFKVQDNNNYEVWFYQTVGEPNPPEGAKIV